MSKIANLKEMAEIRALTDAELDHVSGGAGPLAPVILGIAIGALVSKPIEQVLTEAGVYESISVGNLLKGKGKQ